MGNTDTIKVIDKEMTLFLLKYNHKIIDTIQSEEYGTICVFENKKEVRNAIYTYILNKNEYN